MIIVVLLTSVRTLRESNIEGPEASYQLWEIKSLAGEFINQTTVLFHSLFKGKDTPPCLRPKRALFNILNSLKTIYKHQRNISLNFQLTSSFCLIMLSSWITRPSRVSFSCWSAFNVSDTWSDDSISWT